MNEYVSEAIVLAKEPQGELDERVTVFTKNIGKLTGKTKSSRKITSKLSPHLEPGNFARVRLVEKGNLQIVDALKSDRLPGRPDFFYLLGRMLPENQPELDLWEMLLAGERDWKKILSVLGWDPSEARCGHCSKPDIIAFHIGTQEFFCVSCEWRVEGEKINIGK